MAIEVSRRLGSLTGYPFAEIDARVAGLRGQGVDVIDFGVGDPTEPTPEVVRRAIKESVDRHAAGGYPSYVGAPEFREAIAAWTRRRFGVELDPATEISASIGSKEAVFNFPEAFVNPGDLVIAPNPGYPPYARGTRFAEGEVHRVNLLAENAFLPDLDSIPKDVARRARIMWVNYPNNPTGAVCGIDFLKRCVEFGRENGIIIASDEAYTENYYGAAPHCMLEAGREGVVVFQSLSKRSCMTGYRVGWVAGDRQIVSAFKKLKTNIDSGTPTFIQDAAIAALSDEGHVEDLRALYREKRDIMVDSFVRAGLAECRPDATLYIWQRIPEGISSVEFAKALLDPAIAVVATPGNWISEETPEGNPGEGYVRLALVPTVEQCQKAADRIAARLRSIV
ncbi:MAG: aminotransferase class I/II-fold pyridoxal phosphate-dependent enzyme [Proteobacteria bacterium]|nr:aminotransferase class I/II-fold pyridoxal phosphate-dependent enzyme [Pseudomonadota bacterium]